MLTQPALPLTNILEYITDPKTENKYTGTGENNQAIQYSQGIIVSTIGLKPSAKNRM
jgi:hypothetical protein